MSLRRQSRLALAPLPQTLRAKLEPYRLAARERPQANPTGGQLMRRKGQSLEFRDFARYVPGDDARHIDWRASMRLNGTDLVVRSFVAEERLKLIISIDTRETMTFPQGTALTKLQAALWLAEAVGTVALRNQDEVVLHRLFGEGEEIVRTGGEPGLRRLATVFGPALAPEPRINLRKVHREFRPAIAWLIATDGYFDWDEGVAQLADLMAEAQAGLCWVLLVDLDSWSYESRPLEEGAWRIEGPRAPSDRPPLDIREDALDRVQEHIAGHKAGFRTRARLAPDDVLAWRWPADTFDPVLLFDQFFFDVARPEPRRLASLFSKRA